jgi:hypothetical protein
MDAKTVRETMIRPKLIESFGATLSNGLITGAIAAGLAGKTEKEKLELMVNRICRDPTVVRMWGEAGAERQRKAWLTLL